MATPGYALAEAHVMRKLHKEKVKQMEEERAKNGSIDLVVEKEKQKPSGCFFWVFKKVHPNNARVMVSVESEDGSWDSKS